MACVHLTVGKCVHPEASAAFGDEPSEGVCQVCPHYDGPARGAGDVVHRVLERTGVGKVVKAFTRGDCNCAKRRAALNSAIPLKPPVDDGR